MENEKTMQEKVEEFAIDLADWYVGFIITHPKELKQVKMIYENVFGEHNIDESVLKGVDLDAVRDKLEQHFDELTAELDELDLTE